MTTNLETDAPIAPLVIRRKVKWGETDTAQIVYTPRFLDYAVEAAETFFDDVLGTNWHDLRFTLGLGSPMVHASLDFFRPLRASEPFDLVVDIEAVSRATITFRITGKNLKGDNCFSAKLVSCLIRIQDDGSIKSASIPTDMRAKIDRYMEACTTGKI